MSTPETENKNGSELTAAAALTSLVGSVPSNKDVKQDEEELEETMNGDGEFEIPLRYTKSGRKRAIPFPLKLMKVLSRDEYSHIISWMPSGKAFAIHKSKLFTAQILPQFFKSAKYSSFTRKLHRWGFMRHYRGEDAGAFFHKDFQKGRLDLVEKMTCYKPQESKPSSARAPKLDGKTTGLEAADPKGQLAQFTQGQLGFDNLGMLQNRMDNVLGRQAAINALQNRVGGRPNIDAAIELEVSRRIEERMNTLAFQQQTMELMHERAKIAALSQLQQRMAINPSAASLNLQGNNLNPSAALALAGLSSPGGEASAPVGGDSSAQKQDSELNMATIRQLQRLGQLPSSIGAKTA